MARYFLEKNLSPLAGWCRGQGADGIRRFRNPAFRPWSCASRRSRMVPGFAQKAPAWERSSGIRERWDFFSLRSLRSLRRGRVFTDGGGREWRKPFGIPTERPGLQLGESYGSERQVRGGRPQAAWRESRSEIHWEGANPMDSDGEGWCRGDFVAGLGTRFVGRLRGSVAAPIEKSTGGMTSVSSDFPRAPARPCKTTHPTRKDHRPPGRRRFSPTKRSTSRRRA